MHRIRQLVANHRGKLATLGDALTVFGAIVLAVMVPGLAPLALVGLSIWAYCKGQENGYAAGFAAGKAAGSAEAALRHAEEGQALLEQAQARLAVHYGFEEVEAR